MTIQSIQKMMATTVSETLTVLYKALVRVGCGLGGLPYHEDEEHP